MIANSLTKNVKSSIAYNGLILLIMEEGQMWNHYD
jgi:hypothetical protein